MDCRKSRQQSQENKSRDRSVPPALPCQALPPEGAGRCWQGLRPDGSDTRRARCRDTGVRTGSPQRAQRPHGGHGLFPARPLGKPIHTPVTRQGHQWREEPNTDRWRPSAGGHRLRGADRQAPGSEGAGSGSEKRLPRLSAPTSSRTVHTCAIPPTAWECGVLPEPAGLVSRLLPLERDSAAGPGLWC